MGGRSRIGGRFSGMRERATGIDRTTLAIFAAGATLFLAIIFPRLYPAAKRGPQCSDLAAPLGGNNRSILAQTGNDQQSLDLELEVENDAINQSGPLTINVTFVNQDIGPIILYLPRDNPISQLAPDQVQAASGLVYEITTVGQSYTRVTQNLPPLATGTAVNPNNLHLLGSRARCTEQFDLGAGVLAGLQPGQEYRVRVFYRNNNPGVWRFDERGTAPTPTAAYADQGIWVGEVSSQEILFRIRTPGVSP